MKPSPEVLLAMLTDTPSRIQGFAAGLSEYQLRVAPSSEQWSMLQVLAHLRACHDVWTTSVYTMLTTPEPKMVKIHPNLWWQKMQFDQLSFAHLIRTFSDRRLELILVLQSMSEQSWQRTGFIEKRQCTIYNEIRRLALHEQHHDAQFVQLRTWLLQS